MTTCRCCRRTCCRTRPTASLVEAARRSLANRVGYAWTSTLLTVVAVEARGRGAWSPWTPWSAGRTDIILGTGPAERPRPDPRRPAPASTDPDVPPPSVDDLPGLRTQAKELTELLDLGFHHREVLGRLGTTVSLGVLVTGPAGSGKSALVRAVAARGRRAGAADLGAGAGRADQRRRRHPAARGGPAKPASRRPGGAADRRRRGARAARRTPARWRRCSGRCSAETVEVRRGGGLHHQPAGVGRPGAARARTCWRVQIAVPLPDQAMRREQLTVLTRRHAAGRGRAAGRRGRAYPRVRRRRPGRAGPGGRGARGAAAEGRPRRRP